MFYTINGNFRREKGSRDLTLNLAKAPIPLENTMSMDNTNTPPKTSITQRLRTDLGSPVEV